MSTLSELDVTNYFKVSKNKSVFSVANSFQFTYASQIVGIFAMTFSKASVALLIRRLAMYHSCVLHTSTPLVSVGIWAAFSLFAAIFQCSLPNPWRATPSECPARIGLLSTVGILNIITDAELSVYIIPGVWRFEGPQRNAPTLDTEH
jgi:hypothetical protein